MKFVLSQEESHDAVILCMFIVASVVSAGNFYAFMKKISPLVYSDRFFLALVICRTL